MFAMSRDRLAIAFVTVVVLAAHLAYQHYSAGDYFFPDSATYLAPAKGMLSGWGFVDAPDDPETMRTPGYPLFLLPFLAAGAPSGTIVAVQHLLIATLAGALFALARRRGARRAYAAAAALTLGIEPLTLHYANKVLSESLSAVLLVVVVAVVLAARARGRMSLFVMAGLLCGVLTLVRPVGVALFAAIALALALESGRPGRSRRASRAATEEGDAQRSAGHPGKWRCIAALVASSLVLPIVWAARNEHETGVFTIASIGGTNMLLYRAAGAMAMEDGGDFKTRLAIRQQQLVAIVTRQIIEEEEVRNPLELPHAVMTSYYSALGRKVFLQHPRGAVLVTLRGLIVNLIDTDWQAMKNVSRLDARALELLCATLLGLMWVACLVGLARLFVADRVAALVILFSIGCFLLVAAGGEAEARFRAPVVPLMALGAAFAGGAGPRAATSGSSPRSGR